MIPKFTALILFLFVSTIYADVIEGVIKNNSTGEKVPSATVRLLGQNTGTYADYKGEFRLPGVKKGDKIRITSIGYEPFTLTINDFEKVNVFLNPTSEKLGEAVITGDITVEEIIQRAIEKREENQSKIKTFQGELYSKVVVKMDGNVFAEGDDESFTVGGSVGTEKVDESYKMLILETFSDNFRDFEEGINKSIIKQRRQTANIPKNNNLLTISDFFNFYQDDLKIVNTTFETPLGTSALSAYNFELVDKIKYEDKYVYRINFTPSSSVTPSFKGQMDILEGTYELIGINATPGDDFKIKFLEGLTIEEKFTEVKDGIWYPTYLNSKADGEITIIAGLAEISASLDATSIYNNTKVNEPLPDSLYNTETKPINVAESADSTNLSYWENNSLREITEEERKIYNEVDSLVKKRDTVQAEEENFSFNWNPYINYNRVERYDLGAEGIFRLYDNYNFLPEVYYSFGQQTVQFDLKAEIDLFDFMDVYGGYFQTNDKQTYNRDYAVLLNALTALLFRYDYHDYFRKEGFYLGTELFYEGFLLDLSYTGYDASNLNNTTTNGFLPLRDSWRENRQVSEGNISHFLANLEYGEVSVLSGSDQLQYKLNAFAGIGSNVTDDSYTQFGGSLDIQLPIIETGYTPITLRAKLSAATSDDETPEQYLYMMSTDLTYFSNFDSFFSSPFGYYGGKEYHALNLKLDLSDYFWRAIGLPSINEKRGLSFGFAYSTANFSQDTYNLYQGTGDEYYSEAGFDIGRIPTFISDLVYLQFSARWGIGNIADGRFGWGLGVSSPF